ncbi:MAG: TonB-dependent receptor [Sphingomonadaceae bacterium]
MSDLEPGVGEARIIRKWRTPALASSLAFGLGSVAPLSAQPPADTEAPAGKAIIVTGTRAPAPALDRIATTIVDTPQSITSVTSQELADRGISNLNDALRNVAGISLGAGETSFQGNNAVLRGFTTRNDLFLDNTRDYGYYYRDTFDDASVEVLKGPSSILFGRGSTGGVIHRVSKLPTAQTFGAAELRVGLDDTRRIATDLNIAEPFGEGSGFRVNAVYHRSGVADRDTVKANRWAIAPKLSVALSSDTKLLVSYLHQEERNLPDYGIPWIPGSFANPGFPAGVRRSTYYGFTNDFLNSNVNILTAKIDHQLSSSTQIRSQVRYSHNDRAFRYSEAIIPAGTPRTAPLDAIRVSRNLFQGSSTDEFLHNQTELTTRFTLGGTSHILITGFEVGREATDPVYVTNFAVPGTTLVNPAGGFYNSTPNSFVRLRGRARSTALGLFAIDTIDLDPAWKLIIGLRWDSFRTKYESAGFNQAATQIATTRADRTDRNLSYRAAIVFKPAKRGSLYLSYANSFNPSGEGVESLISAGRSVAQANLNLDPETSVSFEAGTKWNLLGDKALLSASVFRIEKNNARVPDPATPGFNSLGGKQRVDGAEIEFNGEILPGWSVRFGYAFLDSQTLVSSPAGPIVGAPLIITARHMGSVSTSYDLFPKFNIGVNFVATSQRLGQNSNASFLIAPGYQLVDLSAKYQVSDKVTAQILVNNVGNRLYYEQLHPVHVIPGAGRTALATLKIGF